MSENKPTLNFIIETVKNYDKRVGLRLIYKQFDVAESDKYKYKELWDMIKEYQDAAEEWKKPQDDSKEHIGVEENGSPAEAVSCDSVESSGQIEEQTI